MRTSQVGVILRITFQEGEHLNENRESRVTGEKSQRKR